MILICSTYVHQSAKLFFGTVISYLSSLHHQQEFRSPNSHQKLDLTQCVLRRCSETGLTGFPLKEDLNKSDESEVNCIQVPLFGRAYFNLFMKMEFFLWVCVPWEQNSVYLFHDARIREGVQRVG